MTHEKFQEIHYRCQAGSFKEFMAHARPDMNELFEEIERLRQENQDLKDQIRELESL